MDLVVCMKRPTGIHDLHNLKKSYEKIIIMIIIMITIEHMHRSLNFSRGR